METAEGGARFMRVTTQKGTTRYRVTKVVGGRYREDFVGIEDSGIGDERVLPATYVFATQSVEVARRSVSLPSMAVGWPWSLAVAPCCLKKARRLRCASR